jgi:type IV pilus assembly protein PilY1
MTTTFFKTRHLALAVASALLSCIAPAVSAETVSIGNVPLDVALNKARTVMVLDDSGSMDFELMVDGATDGILYWNTNTNTYEKTQRNGQNTWYRVFYLFPNGYATDGDGDARRHPNNQASNTKNIGMPPLRDYVWTRSPDFNPTYYDPKVTYTAWPRAVIAGQSITFPDSPPTAARSHPYFTAGRFDNAGTPTTMDLTSIYMGARATPVTNCNQLATTGHANWTFWMYSGAQISSTVSIGGTTYPVCVRAQDTNNTWTQANNGTLTSNVEAAIPYRPSTFWLKDPACTAAFPTCAQAPDGTRLRGYDIETLSYPYTLPDGTAINRTLAEERQNFANWFTYYRKRSLLMAAGMGSALDSLQKNYRDLTAAAITLNNLPRPHWESATNNFRDLKFYDLTSTNDQNNARALMGLLYSMRLRGGTPTYDGLNAAGKVYRNDVGSVIGTDAATELALKCSANSAFILTDGYATDVSATKRLYDLAKQYYDNMRSWTPAGGLHTMNTYGITLGAKGTLFQPGATPPDPVTGTWPAPVASTPTAIDDLWRATLYSKGKLLSASNVQTLKASINDIINSMFNTGTQSALGYENLDLAEGNTVVQASYESGSWTGKLIAYPAYTTGALAGQPNYSMPKWSAGDLLDARTTARKIVTYDPASKQGIPFTAAALDSAGLLAQFNSGAVADGADVVAWLRGDRSKEGNPYRERSSLLGDITHANVEFVSGAVADYGYSGYKEFVKETVAGRSPVVYVGANDGMLHAFNANNGEELWAYVPSFVHGKLKELAKPEYSHQFYVDGQVRAWDVNIGTDAAPNWRTVLIGGLRGGGKGYYALDVSNAAPPSETAAAARVMWEFTDSNMGYTFAKPVIRKTKAHGWVALLPSGYKTADGKGRLYVVSVADGTLLKTFTIDLTTGAGYDEVGLAHVGSVVDWRLGGISKNAILKYAYAGDLNGNLWRFDFSSDSASDWGVKKLAANLNVKNETGTAAITSAPYVAMVSTPAPTGGFPSNQDPRDAITQRLMVFVGNGLLLHPDDLPRDDKNNGFWAIHDADDDLVIGETSACAPARNCLMQVGLAQAANSLGANNWGSSSVDQLNQWWVINRENFNYEGRQRAKRGWFYAFSETGGERVIQSPLVFGDMVTFATTMRTDTRHNSSASANCEQTYSALYRVDTATGGQVEGISSRINIGFGIASPLTLVKTEDGYRVSFGIKGTDGAAAGAETVKNPPTPGGQTLQRYGWREIYREN